MKNIILGFLLLTVLCGCETITPPNQNTAKTDIITANKDVTQATETLTKTTKDITDNAIQIDKKTSAIDKPVIQPHTAAILQNTAIQGEVLKQLDEVKKLLDTATTKSEKFEKLYLAEQTARKKAEESATKHIKDLYTTVSVVCFAGAIICAVLFATGNTWASIAGLACGAGCIGSLFIVQTVALVPWVVGGLLVIAVGFLIWQFIEKNGKIKTLDTATTELVKTVEAQKPLMSAEARRNFFGDGPIPGNVVNNLQSSATQNIIKQKRTNISLAPSVSPTVSA